MRNSVLIQFNMQTREVWVDNVKVVACILVVLGHFFQSMVKSDIIPDSLSYQWFNTTIYYFHVPLFFICSGYLYQKYSRICTFKMWTYNISKKALALGVPYTIPASSFTVLVFICSILYIYDYANL